MQMYVVKRLRSEEHYFDAEDDEQARVIAELLAADQVMIPGEDWVDSGPEDSTPLFTVERIEFVPSEDPELVPDTVRRPLG